MTHAWRRVAAVALAGTAAIVAASSATASRAVSTPAPATASSPTFDPSSLPMLPVNPTPQAPSTPYPGGIIVGPSLAPKPTPSSTPEPSGASNGQDSPGVFDIPGHVRQAIDDWFRNLVQSALDPVLGFLGETILATPDVTGEDRVRELWGVFAGIANGLLVLFVLAGAAVVMTHETVHTRYSLKEIAPRLVVGAIAANISLGVVALGVHFANALSQAILGQGVDPVNATAAIRDVVLLPLVGGGPFIIMLGLVIAVVALTLLFIYIARVALLIILVVAGPLVLACHALPQTEGIAQMWWRAVVGIFAVQLGQSLVLVTALRVFFDSGHHALGFSVSGSVVDMLVCLVMLWVLVRIPSWVGRFVRGNARRTGGIGGQVAKLAIAVKAAAAFL